jgi:hypothetical protein
MITHKKSGLVMHPPGNPAEPERVVTLFYGDFAAVHQLVFIYY